MRKSLADRSDFGREELIDLFGRPADETGGIENFVEVNALEQLVGAEEVQEVAMDGIGTNLCAHRSAMLADVFVRLLPIRAGCDGGRCAGNQAISFSISSICCVSDARYCLDQRSNWRAT